MASSDPPLLVGGGLEPLLLAQDQLDLPARPDRTSALPWRGQFNPVLVDHILTAYARPGAVVCDPFAGSGTVLLEAARDGLESIGAEVNPAAVELASVATLASIPASSRAAAIEEATEAIDRLLRPWEGEGVDALPASLLCAPVRVEVAAMVGRPVRTLVAAAILLAMKDRDHLTSRGLRRSLDHVSTVVDGLPTPEVRTTQYLADARALPVERASVDLVVTSPPYVNVFNYHHNYRPAVEMLGWDVLEAARSEFGSNRKHRGNRFLTVVQYSMDMARTLGEVGRVLGPGGTAVLVVGRESNVLGCPFYNGQIVLDLCRDVLHARIRSAGERSFLNRFGATIFEEVLVVDGWPGADLDIEVARSVGTEALAEARARCSAAARPALEQAIERSSMVNESPLYMGPEASPFPRHSVA